MNATSRLSKLISTTAPLELLGVGMRHGSAAMRREWNVAVRTRRRGLPRCFVEDVFDGTDVEIRLAHPGRYASKNVHEMACLAVAAATTRPRKILEIGTCHGATALLLAANAPEATVYTLNLPPDGVPPLLPTAAPDREVIAACRGAMLYDGRPEAERIVQLWGDSATFDFGVVGDGVDLAFIDGAHSYEYVRNDTEKVLRLMRPGGVIIWDDYADLFPGVVRYLNEIGRRGLCALAATSLAVCRLPKTQADVAEESV